MGLPIYQIEAYQKAPPKVKHTGTTQKSAYWSWQLENIKFLQKKSTKSTKTIRVTPAGLRNGSSNLLDGSVSKAPPKVKHTDITQKSPNWLQQLENIKSLQKNSTKSKKSFKTLE